MRFLILLVIFITSVSAIAQEKQSPALVDEFGFIHCDEMLARIDNFFNQLNNNLTVKGFVIISGSNEHLIEKLKLEILLTSGVQQRRHDSSRLTVIRGKETGNAMMRFWLLPDGVETPEQPTPTWNLTIPKGTKPFYFHSDSDSICIYPTVYKYLRELLEANPKLRINTVVWKSNLRKFRKEAEKIRENLGDRNSHRIRFFQKRELVFYESTAEFWLLP